MVSDALQSKGMKYVVESSTNNIPNSLYRPTSPPPPQQRTNMLGTSPLLKIRGLRKRIPQRDRYYTEDYALQNYCDKQKCDPTLNKDPSVQIPAPPSFLFSSPRSTITAAASSTRFLRSHFLGTIRNQNSTKDIIIDDNQCDDVDVDARSQSFEVPLSLLDHESHNQDQAKRIEAVTYNVPDIQIWKGCMEQLHTTATPTTPKTSDTRTTCTPICYEMTNDENPFVLGIDESMTKVQAPLPPLSSSIDIEPMKNDTIRNNKDVEYSSTLSLTVSVVSTISSDSVRRFNNEPIDTSAPMFPPLEIRCHHRISKYVHRNDSKHTKSKEIQVPSIGVAVNHNWYDSWVANVEPSKAAVSTPTDEVAVKNVRPPDIQTIQDPSLDHSMLLFRLNAPKNNAVRREVPVRLVDIVSGDNKLSPLYAKSAFKPIREKSSETNDDDDHDSGSAILFATSLAHSNCVAPAGVAILPASFKPSHVTKSKTTGAIGNDRMTNRNDIFRKRTSYQQTPQQRETASTNRETNSSRVIPRRQFQRTSFNSINNSLRKPMSIQIPSKSVPTGQPNGTANLRRESILSSSTFGGESRTSHNGMNKGTIMESIRDDPLLQNIPRRRVSQNSKSVFSFGSIVGQSTASSSSFLTKPQSLSRSANVSTPAAKGKPSPMSSLSKKIPSVLRNECDVEGGCDDDAGFVPKEYSPKIRTKTTPFYNEMDYYWKQTKKRLFTTTTKVVEKPNSMTSLQRNPSGCLA